MPILVQCPGCQAKLKAPDNWAGKRIACPKCKAGLSIPGEKPAAVPERATPPAATAPSSPAKPAAKPADSDDDFILQPIATVTRPVVPLPTGPTVLPGGIVLPNRAEEARKKLNTSKAEALVELRHKRELERPEWLAWLWLLLFFPLLIASFLPALDIEEKFKKAIEATPDLMAKLEAQSEGDFESSPSLSVIISQFPNGKLEGALFRADSGMHWLIGLVSAGFFAGLLTITFRFSSTQITHAIGIAIVTGTAGIVVLLFVQMLAAFSLEMGLRPRGRGVITLILLVLQFIGFSYRCATDPSLSFWPSFFGFTFGVGLCEELCKAFPIFVMLKNSGKLGWRGAAIWGLASGVGFGLSEAIMYSGSMYNGIFGSSIYWIRFLSCVGLHAMWSATVAILMWRGREEIQDAEEWSEWGIFLGKYLAVSMVLHGLYDSLLKANLEPLALIVAIGSFFLFVGVMHSTQAATGGNELA